MSGPVMPEVRDTLSRAIAERNAPRLRLRRTIINGRRYAVIATLLATASAAAALVGTHPWTAGEHQPTTHRVVGKGGTVSLSAKESQALGVLSAPLGDGVSAAEVGKVVSALGTPTFKPGSLDPKRARILRRRGNDLYLLVPTVATNLAGAHHPYGNKPIVCIMHATYTASDPTPHGGTGCGTRAEMLGKGQIMLRDALGGSVRIAGVAPDKVARVVVNLRGFKPMAAKVNHNFFVVDLGVADSDPFAVPDIRWFDKKGRQIKKRT
jgi:hypothetical protein